MRIRAMLAMLAVAGMASGRTIEIGGTMRVPVCVQTVNSRGWATLMQAEGLASRMFVAADVAIEWRGWNGCPADGIRISLSTRTAPSDHPGAFAYALPYEGTHIVLFWDRMGSGGEERILPYLAAHVMVHEVTHILQGLSRHSETGVMKAKFRQTDIAEMGCRPLPFTAEDVELIRAGIVNRRSHSAQAAGE